MNQHAIPGLRAVLLLGAALAGPVLLMPARAGAAGLDLPGGCAVGGSASLHEAADGFEAGRLELVVPGLGLTPAPALHAARLQASAGGAAPVGAAVLEQASSAAAAALLTALSGRHAGGCPDAVLQAAMRPLAHGLEGGGRYEFTWSDVSVRSGATRFGARHLSLHVAGDGQAAHLTAALDGAVSNDPASGLLPESLDLRAALPASQVPALLSAAGGHGAPVDVTIEQADAHRGGTALSGHGEARIARTPDESSGQGHVSAQGIDTLIEAATESGLDRLRTALFLAKLVAHRSGDRADWDLLWQGGTLLVNNVPLPLR